MDVTIENLLPISKKLQMSYAETVMKGTNLQKPPVSTSLKQSMMTEMFSPKIQSPVSAIEKQSLQQV